MEDSEHVDDLPWTDKEYLAWAVDSVSEFDAGEGVVVKVVTPPAGKGPKRFVVLVDGHPEPPPTNRDSAMARANFLSARRRKARQQGPDDSTGYRK